MCLSQYKPNDIDVGMLLDDHKPVEERSYVVHYGIYFLEKIIMVI